MKNLFVPYEIAVMAKDAGFDEGSLAFFNTDGNFFFPSNDFHNPSLPQIGTRTSEIPVDFGQFAAPLYQQLTDWLREDHHINIVQDINSEHFCFMVGERKFAYGETYYEAYNTALIEAFKLIK